MRPWFRLIFFLAVLILVGCEEDLELGLRPNDPVRISYDGSKRTELILEPSTETYQQIASWVATNKSGWTPLMATPPLKGVWVSNGEISLQFQSSSVIAHTRRGVFTKTFDPSKNSFVRGGSGT
jgi:hypothetical protein